MYSNYLKYEGKYYDVGTKVKIKTRWCGIQEATFCGWGTYPFRGENISDQYYSWDVEKYIVEIVEPIEVVLELVNTNNRIYPSEGDVDIGWIWYIFIMLIATIFNARILIWIVATTIFFLWKNGLLNGGKK